MNIQEAIAKMIDEKELKRLDLEFGITDKIIYTASLYKVGSTIRIDLKEKE